MASTVPAKSQPLHNFTLPHLKWNNKDRNSSGHHQRRRSIKSPSRRQNIYTASPVRQSPLRDSVSATPPRHQSPVRDSVAAAAASPRGSPAHGDFLGKRSPTPGESSKPHQTSEWGKHSPAGGDIGGHFSRHNSLSESEASGRGKGGGFIEHRKNHSNILTSEGLRNGLLPTNLERTNQNLEVKSKAKEADASGIKRSKILIKIPCKNSKAEDESPVEEPPKIDNNEEDDCSGEVQDEKINNNNIDEETKTWNLRPRKPIRKSLNVNGITVRNSGPPMPERSKAQSPLRNLNNRSGENDGGNGGKKEKRKLGIVIPLSKEEIEEDIFALTGSKPARRPKKRAKNVQKQVDIVFPGLWLVSINADSYKVSENSLKG